MSQPTNQPDYYAEFFKNYKIAEALASDRDGALSQDAGKVTKSRSNLEKIIKTELNGGIPAETWDVTRLVATTKDIEEVKRQYALGMFAQAPSKIITQAIGDSENKAKILKNYLALAPVDLESEKYAEVQVRHQMLYGVEELARKLAAAKDTEGKEKAFRGFGDIIVNEMVIRNGGAPEQYVKLLKSIYASAGDSGRVAMIDFSRGNLKKGIETQLDEAGRIKYAKALLDATLGDGKDGGRMVAAGVNLYNLLK